MLHQGDYWMTQRAIKTQYRTENVALLDDILWTRQPNSLAWGAPIRPRGVAWIFFGIVERVELKFGGGSGWQVERRRHENRDAEGSDGDGLWGWEGCAPRQKIFLNFYIKMVSCRAFWVAISYRLAACFTEIGSTCGIEI